MQIVAEVSFSQSSVIEDWFSVEKLYLSNVSVALGAFDIIYRDVHHKLHFNLRIVNCDLTRENINPK